jgi:hypothetical protein
VCDRSLSVGQELKMRSALRSVRLSAHAEVSASLSRLLVWRVRSACWWVECDRAANVDAPLFADGWLFESCYRSPGHQLL